MSKCLCAVCISHYVIICLRDPADFRITVQMGKQTKAIFDGDTTSSELSCFLMQVHCIFAQMLWWLVRPIAFGGVYCTVQCKDSVQCTVHCTQNLSIAPLLCPWSKQSVSRTVSLLLLKRCKKERTSNPTGRVLHLQNFRLMDLMAEKLTLERRRGGSGHNWII